MQLQNPRQRYQFKSIYNKIDTLRSNGRKAVVDGKYSDAKAKYNRLSEMEVCDAARKEADVDNELGELRTLKGKQEISVEIVAGVGANKPLYKVNSDSSPVNYSERCQWILGHQGKSI
ncbi:hypothetical protein MUK70_15040 [Dyadobacter chenwenxiniae]|uniref:Uncharacterized protein n=1 Tax=Dyadobacter chenwenxiniae TaxID=2906456 RepID=A0A9X1PG42_9BACT|nr:hypothetical protein [Dyadobacter chenwenxiniae]MCF0060557.1 hypothetical protein [Dyadobacter chenwenxiniae]UON86288.1 hypothetical protein MUK70_15040 [Dyadobacter chenwenxiniae]